MRRNNLGADKVAVSGYDPVAYFSEHKALKGRKEISVIQRCVTYCCASEGNQKVFAESPGQYLPAYDGWCATALTKGEKVEIDAKNFKITNGRLFLLLKASDANALRDWNKDDPNLLLRADASWRKLAAEQAGSLIVKMRPSQDATSRALQVTTAAIFARTRVGADSPAAAHHAWHAA